MQTELCLNEIKRAWIDDAINLLEHTLLARGNQVTAEDMRLRVTPPPHPNWIGCMVAKLRCSGRIKEVGRVKSNRPERNGAKITLWETV